MSFIDRLKEDLDQSADWNPVVSVSRRDLEQLIAEYEQREENEEGR